MKVDLSKPVLDLDSREIREGETVVTFYNIFKTALIGDFEEKSTEQRFDDFKLALKLKNGEVDLELEEVTRIKSLIGKIPSTVVVGRSLEFIENIGK